MMNKTEIHRTLMQAGLNVDELHDLVEEIYHLSLEVGINSAKSADEAPAMHRLLDMALFGAGMERALGN